MHPNVVEADRDESHSGDKSGGGALEHAESFVESVGGAEGSQGDIIRVDG